MTNRILSVLKAILNRAYRAGAVADDSPWRKVKPFEKADEARIHYLTDAECCPASQRMPRRSTRPRASRIADGCPVGRANVAMRLGR